MEALVIIVVFLVSLTVSFMPSVIGFIRSHNNALPILMVNIFLGWTVIGWIVALVWACSDNVKKKVKKEDY